MKISRAILILASLICIAFLLTYLSTQSNSIFAGDSGDLVTASYVGGIAHPPGYPIYTSLGYISSHLINYKSVAWRISLLSSIPFALGLSIFFIFSSLLTSTIIGSLIATATLGTTYIYWLYASVPEVFGLHILLASLQLLFLYLWTNTKNKKFGILFILFFILSLSHHQTILFFTPAYIYLLSKHKKNFIDLIKSNQKWIVIILLFGMLPLLYFVISINRQPLYTWGDTLSIGSIIKIITRASYGTFTSGSIFVENPLARFTGVYAYFIMLLEDFTIPGTILAIYGAIIQFKRKRQLFNMIFLAYVCTGPLYFLYGAYLLTNAFTVATFERFLISSYLFVALWLAEGIANLVNSIETYLLYIRKKTQSSLTLSYKPIFYMLIALIPLNLFFINQPKISVLKNDNTAELLSKNALDSTEKNAILILAKDNEIFNTSYMNIVNKYRDDVIVISKSQLFYGRRLENLKSNYPDIYFPEKNDKNFDINFIKYNISKRPIYTNEIFSMNGEYFGVREGILYKIYPKDNMPSQEEVLEKNNILWKSYHDPYANSLAKYQHLMLKTYLLIYSLYSAETGDYFLAAGLHSDAEKYYKRAEKYSTNSIKLYMSMSISQMEQNKCKEAEKSLLFAYKNFPDEKDRISVPLLFIKLYSECLKNNDKANEWKKVYERMKEKQEQQLIAI